MRMMHEAIDGARDFQDFMEKIVADEQRLKRQVTQGAGPGERLHDAGVGRLTGENRAAHRARLKRERRESKAHGARA